MKKIIIRTIALSIVFIAILYSMASFYYLDFDPHNWDEAARFAMAVMILPLICLAAAIANIDKMTP